MSYGKRSTWDEIRELAFGDLSDTYNAVGDPTSKAIRAIKLSNFTDASIYFTDDSTQDKIKVPPNGYELWDVTANKAKSDLPQFIGIGKTIYARHITSEAPTRGWVAIECLIVENGS